MISLDLMKSSEVRKAGDQSNSITIYFLSEFSLWNHTQYREFENCRWRIGVRELWVTRGGEHQVDLEELGRAPVGRCDDIYTGQLKPFQRVQYIEEVEIDRYHIFYFFKGIVFLSLSHSYYLLTTFMAHQNHPSLLGCGWKKFLIFHERLCFLTLL